MKNIMKKRDALSTQLMQCSSFARGSITSVCGKCNRAGCICEKKTSRRAYRLTYKDSKQKTRIVYIPKGRLYEIRKMVANYSKLRKIIDQIVETNLEIFKNAAEK